MDSGRLFMLCLAVLLCLAPSCTRREGSGADCAINAGPCAKNMDGLSVMLDISPKPVRAMQDLTFFVQLTGGEQSASSAGVEIDLTMPGMRMGENRVPLRQVREGVYEGRGVIVRCPSGEKLWRASVVVDRGERSVVADFLFEAP